MFFIQLLTINMYAQTYGQAKQDTYKEHLPTVYNVKAMTTG